MGLVTITLLSTMAGIKANDNMRSVLSSLDQFGPKVRLDRPHRIAHFLAQVLWESGDFKYDRELWGPTPAQQRYDTRADLGNTPAKDGDGFKNRGRGPIQVTGGYNIAAFEKWCRDQGYKPPDFTADPDLINTDPWEGLSAIWYWSVHNLNALADENNIEQITKAINGGLNGFDERLVRYIHVALVLLGYGRSDVSGFQKWAKSEGLYAGEIDGDAGPKTRAAMHKALVRLDGSRSTASAAVRAAPVVEATTVVEEKAVPVVPEGAQHRTGLWTAAMAGMSSVVASVWGAISDMPLGVKIAIGVITLLAIGFMLFRGELVVRRVKAIVKEIET